MIDIKEPNDLRATLQTMKSAKRQGVNMNIWDRDIEAVENAIAVIEAIRAMPLQDHATEAVEAGKREVVAWAERDQYLQSNVKLLAMVEAARMARTRLERFADQANAGQVHHDARELKRRIWASFAEFDEAIKPRAMVAEDGTK